MTVQDLDRVDFAGIDRKSGNMILAISDHLDWNENEGDHLFVLQNKLNAYLDFIESGQIYSKFPRAMGRQIVVQVIGKFPLSDEAKKFYGLAGKAIEHLGYSLSFRQHKAE